MKTFEPPYALQPFSMGNGGTGEQAANHAGLRCSPIKERSGNGGTQLCSLNNHPPLFVPLKKTVGTKRTSESRMLERFSPKSPVPRDFEIRRGNKGGMSDFC